MNDLVEQLADALTAERPLVFCTLVETRGSTPQKAGAWMLVFPDGTQGGTLGGGCVEADVKRTALRALDEGTTQVARFQLDDDYGWDDGLICGGRMSVLIEPVRDQPTRDFYARLAEMIRTGQGGTWAVAFDEAKSGLPPASAYLFGREGELLAQLRPGAASEGMKKLQDDLTPLVERPRPHAREGIAYLPFLPRCRLVIVGGGHVGRAVGQLAADLDFDVWAIDDRPEYVSEERFPEAERRIHGVMGEVLPQLDITPDTYCLIVTRGHNHDEEALLHLVDRGARYVGMIGSKRKIRLIFEDLIELGVSREVLEKVHAPVGIDIGSQTVPEIAVSIAAELVSHRNRQGTVPGRPEAVSLAEM